MYEAQVSNLIPESEDNNITIKNMFETWNNIYFNGFYRTQTVTLSN